VTVTRTLSVGARLIAAFTFLVGFISLSAQTPSGLAGRWNGVIDIGGTTLPMAVAFVEKTSGLTATIDIQGAKGVPLDGVTYSASDMKVHFDLAAGLGLASFDGTFDGTTIRGTFAQNAVRGTFTLAREGAPKAPAAPKALVPYREEDVTFKNGAITLAGTLTIPQGQGPFPAFVMVTGTGLQNRDEEILGFKIFAVIADHMARHGIATLRYDDRGAGGSTGSIATATTEDFAGDALAGVALLAGRSEVDRAHIGVFGHSEGGAVAAIAAAKSPGTVGFIIMMAGPAVSGAAVLHQQVEDGARSVGATDEQVARVLAGQKKVFDALAVNASTAVLSDAVREMITAQLEGRPDAARAAIGDIPAAVNRTLPNAVAQVNNPWMRAFVALDPATFMARVTCPVYAAFGAKDTQVPPALHRGPLEAALAKGGNARVTIKVYPDANHLFIKANTGQVSEYATLPKVFVPEFLDDLVAFVGAAAKSQGRGFSGPIS
jgi:pimeloyl-ACP methyl ester carboxylesterase